jgi:hypothetical protein
MYKKEVLNIKYKIPKKIGKSIFFFQNIFLSNKYNQKICKSKIGKKTVNLTQIL